MMGASGYACAQQPTWQALQARLGKTLHGQRTRMSIRYGVQHEFAPTRLLRHGPQQTHVQGGSSAVLLHMWRWRPSSNNRCRVTERRP